MKKTALTVFLLCCLFLTISVSASDNGRLIGARFPALSPDGSKIAFTYMGDIWTVSSTGGTAVRLTSHAAYDREPVWSPDGSKIAFSSNRNGNNDIYIVSSSGGVPEQLTFHTGSDIVTDFSPDGKSIYFIGGRHSRTSIFRISVYGGNAVPVLDTYWSWPADARVKPDGSGVMFALGMENGFKWRKGYRGTNSAKIWFKPFNSNSAQELVNDRSNSYWPAWSGSGNAIYFVSDRDLNCSNIWTADPDGSGQRNITRFREHNIRALDVARNVQLAVYERDFGLWTTDLESGRSTRIEINSPAETRENSTFFVNNGRASEFWVSPDGKKIAAVVRGEVFVLSTDGGYARNITNSPWRERNLTWTKDSKKVIFVSDRGANPNLFITSALGDDEPRQLTDSDDDILDPTVSPDGEWIAYYEGKRSLRVVKPDGSDDRLVIEDDFGGRFADGFAWSPDSKYIAIVTQTTGNSDIFAVNVETGEKTALTNTAYDESYPVWSSDGKSLFFGSNRYGHSFPEFTGKWDIYRLFLEPKAEEFEEDEFEEMFAEKSDDDDEGKDDDEVSVTLRLDDIDRQTEQIANTLGNDRNIVVSPKDPNTVYFTSNMDGTWHLWKIEYKDGKWGRYEPFLPHLKNVSGLEFDKDGKYLYYISRGKLGKINVSSKKNESISFNTKIEVDRTADYEQMLGELYYVLQYYFYDEDHHNVNWKRLYEQFLPVLKQVREDTDFYDYANELIGYLNSSHTGMRSRPAISVEKPSAHLGAIWNFDGRDVTLGRIVAKSPLHAHRDSVSAGDRVISIDGEPVRSNENIWKLLNGKMGKRVKLTVNSASLNRDVTVALKPIPGYRETRLIMDEWVESRREIVLDRTGGKGSYIHMAAMGYGDLTKFLKELQRDAVPSEGLILDLRYNMGGNVHDRVLQALSQPTYAKWRIRGMSETKQSTFGFSDKPIVLLINEVTLSDGEMTTSGFKTLKRGTIVGNTTYGWLIFTTSNSLMNGGYFRLPFWGCYTLDGENLERNGGVTPDIEVINDLNDDLNGTDPQLDRAIEELLKKIR